MILFFKWKRMYLFENQIKKCFRLEPMLYEIRKDHRTMCSSYLDWIIPQNGRPLIRCFTMVQILQWFLKKLCWNFENLYHFYFIHFWRILINKELCVYWQEAWSSSTGTAGWRQRGCGGGWSSRSCRYPGVWRRSSTRLHLSCRDAVLKATYSSYLYLYFVIYTLHIPDIQILKCILKM